MLVQVGIEDAGDVLGDVAADATLFLGHTATVNDTAARDPGTCDGANF